MKLNNKGFTLIEILVVIAIIAILFIMLIPQIDKAQVKARETGIKTDFRAIEQGVSNQLRTSNGKVSSFANTEDFNLNLDKAFQIKNISGGDTDGDGQLDSVALGEFSKEDPWGDKYKFTQLARANPLVGKGIKVIIKSFGKDEKENNYFWDPSDSNDPEYVEYDDYTLAVYMENGNVASCTLGFQTNNITLETFSFSSDTNGDGVVGCGDDIN